MSGTLRLHDEGGYVTCGMVVGQKILQLHLKSFKGLTIITSSSRTST